MAKKTIKQGHLRFSDIGKEMMVEKDLFLTRINYVEPLELNEVNVPKVNMVTVYEYDGPLDTPFILETYELNFEFFKRINVKGGIIKMCHRCEKYYDEVRVLFVNLRKHDQLDSKEKEKDS